MTALDTEHGGDFTMYITGNKHAQKLKRPVVCSTRSREECPLPAAVKSYPYSDRLKGELCVGDRFVMAQHFHQDRCTLFSAAIPSYDVGKRRAMWCTRSSYSGLVTWVKESCWENGFNVMHMSCSGDRFGAYAVHGFGSGQQIIAGSYDHIRARIKQKGNDAWSITCICPGIEHDWVAVVTQCKADYLYGDSKGSQSLCRASSWAGVRAKIQEKYKAGQIVTHLAISNGTWLLATHASSRQQRYRWGPEDGSLPVVKEEFWDYGLDVTLLLKDPSDGRWLLFGTGGLKAYNCSYYTDIAQSRVGIEGCRGLNNLPILVWSSL